MADGITSPRTETEQTICEIWKELLSLDQVGIDDKFFEVGGSSLHVVLLVSMLDERFPGKVHAADLFDRPTIRQIAAFIDGREAEEDAVGVEL